MRHLNTPPRPTLTAFEPRSSAVGSVWVWSVLGTSGPTFQSTPSQETAPSTEVRQIQLVIFVDNSRLSYQHCRLFAHFFPVLSVLDKNTAQGRDPKHVAQAVLKAVRQRNDDVILAGPLPSLAIYLRTLWPALFFKLMASRARKEQKPKDEWHTQQQSMVRNAAFKVEKAKPPAISGVRNKKKLITLFVTSWAIAFWKEETNPQLFL